MELDILINYIKENWNYPKNISVPSFTFNNVLCKNVDFLFMGFAESTENKGKAIYMSKDCLPDVHVSMDDLLKINGAIQTDKGIGECDIGKSAVESLDKEVFSIVGKHLQPYVREYDGKVHTEKIFFPLECEVFGKIEWSNDIATLSKYPQWESFNKSKDLIIKHIDYSSNKYETWDWWEANKSEYSGYFCVVNYDSSPNINGSYIGYYGVGIAFCL